jgi:RimJ/RimL family protein N-acetyltransferase
VPPANIPETIQTNRLLLRAPRSKDGPAIHAAVLASLPELRQWMSWAQEPLDEAGYTSSMTRAAADFATREELRYLIWDPAGQELIGSSGFHSLNWQVPKGEIGYWLASKYVGQGYATETAQALTEFGFGPLGFRRIEIRCDSRNHASAAVAHRLGYGLDIKLVNNTVAADKTTELRDTLVFSRVR